MFQLSTRRTIDLLSGTREKPSKPFTFTFFYNVIEKAHTPVGKRIVILSVGEQFYFSLHLLPISNRRAGSRGNGKSRPDGTDGSFIEGGYRHISIQSLTLSKIF